MLDVGLIIKTLVVLFMAIIYPGPDFVMVLRNALNFGRKAGLASSLGVACGCLISFTIVISGLSFLLSYPFIKSSLSLICGAYLIYMGFISLRNKTRHQHITATTNHAKNLPHYFLNGLFTNIFNPKLYTLAIAILTYTEAKHPTLATNITIIIAQALLSFIWFAIVSLVLSHGKIQDIYLKRERLINILLGFIFVILGSSIMFNK